MYHLQPGQMLAFENRNLKPRWKYPMKYFRVLAPEDSNWKSQLKR